MAACLRSKSESLSTPPYKATSIRHSSVKKDDFIDVTFNKSQIISADLIAFFDSEEFKVEASRKVASYGERYHYKGSTGSEKPIPEAQTWLIEKVKSNMKLQYDLNQVLVNKYESAAAIPSHSDNEGSIKPDSSIFTVSLGSSGKFCFLI